MNLELPDPLQPPQLLVTSSSSGSSNTAAASTTTRSASGDNTMSFGEDPNSKRFRKPYTITKSRESWTEQEHDKFLEALNLFDRDWKKIEAFIGSKEVIQIRSHAQKYFLKVQKRGTSEHVPPPRPKRKAAHPYPQKAPKNAPVVSQAPGPFQSSDMLEGGYVYRPDPSSGFGNPVQVQLCLLDAVPPVNVSHVTKDDAVLSSKTIGHACCYSSSDKSTQKGRPVVEAVDRGDNRKRLRVMPDFAQVYSFIGSVFDPNSSDHLQRLKQMDPINMETVLLLMRNLAINLTSPEFKNHRELISSYNADSKRTKFCVPQETLHAENSQSAIPSA
ncbi:Myb_DNA-binding domain-containing protein [Cephalotus follicularis]|uniref:Myb_DNA-binding domain-containing protein n=1 Tax=Cephalotus follicularis TaxID=3775 RepID=A0A1Q3CTF7_CEPFO|nr:Myb_DNA-binding domain-containing protein [Cephalotus follicularis]